jgi:nicotinamidase-related amidase
MLPLPVHFHPERAGDVYRVPYEERARDAARFRDHHGIPPASSDSLRVGLLLVDVQNTFSIPGFELFVGGRSGTGAVDDNRRLAEFIYRNLSRITRIHATLDTHRAISIFHEIFLVDENGEHPAPMTAVSLEDVESGRIRINPAVAGDNGEALERHLLHYCRTLSDGGKFRLMVWPYHSMLGGIGHAIASTVEEAVFFHTIARTSQASFVMKGDEPLTESYSALGPEVLVDADGRNLYGADDALSTELLGYDALLIAGQAKSHCVSWTLSDLLSEIRRRNPALAKRIYLLEDCMSEVVVPGAADFTDDTERAFVEFEAAGMHRVRASEPVTSWPGFPGGV